MSQENVEIARLLYPDQLDLAAVFATSEGIATQRRAIEPFVDPDFETASDPQAIPMPGEASGGERSVRGIDGFISLFSEWLTIWDTWVVTPQKFIDVDQNRVLVLFETRGRPKGQTTEIPIQGGNLLRFREGKLVKLQLYFNRADALEAAGLSE